MFRYQSEDKDDKKEEQKLSVFPGDFNDVVCEGC